MLEQFQEQKMTMDLVQCMMQQNKEKQRKKLDIILINYCNCIIILKYKVLIQLYLHA